MLLFRDHSYDLAGWLFLVAGITDGLDGYIAKHCNCVSSLGAIFDPLADQPLIAGTYVMLAIME